MNEQIVNSFVVSWLGGGEAAAVDSVVDVAAWNNGEKHAASWCISQRQKVILAISSTYG